MVLGGAGVEIAPEDDPAARAEHGVLSRKQLAEQARGEGPEDAAELEDRGQPALGRGGLDYRGEVLGEAGRNKGLRQDSLLIAIFEASKAGRTFVSEKEICLSPRLQQSIWNSLGRSRNTYDANKAIRISLGLVVMEDHRVLTAVSTRQSAVTGST